MLNTDLTKMHVHDLASLEVLVEECNDHIVGLGDGGQEFLLGDFCISSVAQSLVSSSLFVLLSGSLNACLCHVTKHTFFFLVKGEIGIFFTFRAFSLLYSCIWLVKTKGVYLSLLSGHLLCHVLLSLILDGLLHDHISEEISSEFVVSFHLQIFLIYF